MRSQSSLSLCVCVSCFLATREQALQTRWIELKQFAFGDGDDSNAWSQPFPGGNACALCESEERVQASFLTAWLLISFSAQSFQASPPRPRHTNTSCGKRSRPAAAEIRARYRRTCRLSRRQRPISGSGHAQVGARRTPTSSGRSASRRLGSCSSRSRSCQSRTEKRRARRMTQQRRQSSEQSATATSPVWRCEKRTGEQLLSELIMQRLAGVWMAVAECFFQCLRFCSWKPRCADQRLAISWRSTRRQRRPACR